MKDRREQAAPGSERQEKAGGPRAFGTTSVGPRGPALELTLKAAKTTLALPSVNGAAAGVGIWPAAAQKGQVDLCRSAA